MPHKYTLDISKAVRHGRATVSDFRLSVTLKHSHPDDRTTLLTVKNPATGKVYSLCLCGAIIGFDDKGNRVDAHTLTTDQAEKLDNGAENEGVDLINNPWFEWQDETGNAMGEPFCAIDINPDNEAQELLESLNFKQAKTSQDDTLSAPA